MTGALPIDDLLPALLATLAVQTRAVLTAPPGSGKTTRIPLALLSAAGIKGRILLLEPRRLAARSAAGYMASLLNEPVGRTVGYRMRLDTKIGPETVIEVITEGVLTRMLQSDPSLAGVGAVIFDEFHERSLQSDLGLALCLQCQGLFRPELRILVMSATLDTDSIAKLLEAPVLTGHGRSFPVQTRWLERTSPERIELLVTRAVEAALQTETGDILVFLPGEAEIRRVESLLHRTAKSQIQIAPLYGRLSQAEQDAAILPGSPGKRKIVLATSIAETSLTVEGVAVVIDSGLMRVPRFSPRTGMTRLETVPVSRASADQRRGRAGRLGPGVCWRMWTKEAEIRLETRNKPEILEADLAPLVLELAAWGADAAELKWLDQPPEAGLAQAKDLLRSLGALAGDSLTAHGRELAEAGLHPRLGHMILAAKKRGLGSLACDLAAVLSERDILKDIGSVDADIRLRLEALRNRRAGSRSVIEQSILWSRWFGIARQEFKDVDKCGLLLCFAYPDRIAHRRPDGRFLLANGRGASLSNMQALSMEQYLCIAELDDKGPESRMYLAAPVPLDDIRKEFGGRLLTETVTAWDKQLKAVRARRIERLGAIIVSDSPLADADPEVCLAALLAGIREEGLAMLPWTRAAQQLRLRIQFMRLTDNAWPDLSDAALLASLESWLAPYAYNVKSSSELQQLKLCPILESMLTREQRRELDEYAPTHIAVPSGQKIAVDYSIPDSPILAVKLQELFGLSQTPKIAQGKVPLTLKLLSPAQRPVQVTKDLASFWRTGYFEVKKDLMGRYPKHYWPDDPLQATPTHRVRPRE